MSFISGNGNGTFELFTDGISERIGVLVGQVIGFEIHAILTCETDPTGEKKLVNFFRYEGAIKNISGTTTIVGSGVIETTIAYETALKTDMFLIIAADNTNDCLSINANINNLSGSDWKAVAYIRFTQTTI